MADQHIASALKLISVRSSNSTMQVLLRPEIQTEVSLNGPPLALKPSACLQLKYKFSTVLSTVPMASFQTGKQHKQEACASTPASLLCKALRVHLH